jgi:hypothetical protein
MSSIRKVRYNSFFYDKPLLEVFIQPDKELNFTNSCI